MKSNNDDARYTILCEIAVISDSSLFSALTNDVRMQQSITPSNSEPSTFYAEGDEILQLFSTVFFGNCDTTI